MTRTNIRTPMKTVVSLSALALITTAGVLSAGPLDPPAGPVAGTYKTLTEVFDKAAAAEPRIAINTTNTPGDADSLFKITQPGSYYLTGNITGAAGKHGIEIAASGVTLDLNGFDLVGVGGPAMGAFDGVSVTAGGLTNIAVTNGSVRNWGDEGVDLGTVVARNCRVEGVLVSGNAGTGILVGIGCLVSKCSASGNTGGGFSTGTGCAVTNCTAYQNTGDGVATGVGCTITNCSAYINTGAGINAGSASTVADGSAVSNTLDGIRCANLCIIRGNVCSQNGNGGDGAGIHAAGNGSRIEGNNCANADRGIDVDSSGNLIIKNTCAANALNWDVAAGNMILVVVGAPAGAVVGSAGGAALGSTDPNANFTLY